MPNEMIGKCPVCSEPLKVAKLRCNKCSITIEGQFEPCHFCRLDKSQKYFLEVFIKNRGNIKEIEKELKISYPTVKNKLDDVITALGYAEKVKEDIDRKSVLENLENGTINAEEALRLLK